MKSKNLSSVWGTLAVTLVLTLGLAACGNDGTDGINGLDGADGAGQVISIQRVGRTASQGFGVSAAEIVAFEPAGKNIFAVNAQSGMVDVFSAADLTAPTFSQSIDLGAMLVANGKASNSNLIGAANSVSVSGNLAAVAVEANPKTDAGWVVFVDVNTLAYVAAVQVGSLPDMLTFTPDGSKVVVAIEGEPIDYTVDPEGSVDIITIADFSLQRAGFTDFNTGGSRAAEVPAKVRVFGQIVDSAGNLVRPATVAEDLEPEYLAITSDSTTAYVTLQENNAVAVVDLVAARVTKIIALGFKDHRLPGNELDASDKDNQVNITNWPVYGMFQPDSISTYRVNGVDYFVTANEGDSRADWGIAQTDGTTDVAGDPLNLNMEEFRVKDLNLDSTAFPNFADLQGNTQLGRLKVTSKLGDTDKDGDMDELYVYGGRSFSIWNAATGERVFDSGSQMERLTALKYGADFNNGHDENDPDGRSDAKGPEPEGLTIGTINGHTYAFIGLERMGGVFIYDISYPYAPVYVQYLNDRDLTKDPAVDGAAAGDLGPEGFVFVDAQHSPNGKPLVIVGNEVSGTTAIYQIEVSRLQ